VLLTLGGNVSRRNLSSLVGRLKTSTAAALLTAAGRNEEMAGAASLLLVPEVTAAGLWLVVEEELGKRVFHRSKQDAPAASRYRVGL
jgi:hypothetical protein